MKTINTVKAIVMASLVLSFSSCQKEIAVSPNTVIPGKSVSKDYEANYPFDWDNPAVTTMPVSARLNSPAVSVPWRSNGGLPLDPAIVNDYHRIDGWDLVYCSFSPDDFPRQGLNGVVATALALPGGGLYFALYNRFRGVLRYYLYVPPGTYGYTTQIQHGLQVYSAGNTTKALNFETNEICDNNASAALGNGRGFTKTNKDGLPITGGWYAMQYQIAYDPALTGSMYGNPSFRWDAYSVNISQINLDGTEVGTSRGVIQTTTADYDWSNVNLGLAIIEGFASFGSGSVATAVASGIAGNTTGFLSGLFGTTSAGQQTVDLKINANISTTGSIKSNTPYLANAIPFPLQQVAGSNGVAPLINYPMGVFNLSGRPTVKLTTVSTGAYTENRVYTVDSSLEQQVFQFNPYLGSQFSGSGGASYSNFKTELIYREAAATVSTLVSGKKETIGSSNYFTGVNSVTIGSNQRDRVSFYVAVRVSFYVVPFNPSSPKQFIVKTFWANVYK